ncbi:MAG: EamA family transporter, partial [Chlamydiia bacterium]
MVALSSKAQYKNYFLSPKLSMVFGSALISLGPFFVEYSDLSAATNSFYRMVIGAICFLLIAFFKGEKKAPSLVWQLCSLTGLLLAIDLIVWNQSVLWIGPGLSTVLANIEIVFLVAIGSIFYGEKLPKNYPLLGLGLAASILSLIYPYLGELHPSNVKGILFALGASFSYSLYLLVLKIIGNKSPETSSVTTLALTCLLGATLFGIGLFFLDRSSLIISSW